MNVQRDGAVTNYELQSTFAYPGTVDSCAKQLTVRCQGRSPQVK